MLADNVWLEGESLPREVAIALLGLLQCPLAE